MKPLKPVAPVDGVSASKLILPPGNWADLFTFLCKHFSNVSSERWAERFRLELVLDEDGLPLKPDQAFIEGRVIRYFRELPDEPDIPFQEKILFENEHLLVADKPHFLPVMPRGRFVEQTLLTRLRRQTKNAQLHTLHRIDRETAGLVLLSKNPKTRGLYQNLFRDRHIDKTYFAIAPLLTGKPLPHTVLSRIEKGVPFFQMRECPGIPNSETVIESAMTCGDNLALYRLKPVSGRKHQLRVHMSALGAPIVGDRIYPVPKEHKAQDFDNPLQLLAAELRFTDPVNGKPSHFRSTRKLDGISSEAAMKPDKK